MKIVGVIPARYSSTRFPGKPLADILGKPMIWWVYARVSEAIQETYVATDDDRIAEVCDTFKIPFIMTSKDCSTSTERVFEVSCIIESDVYVCVNGDEPLIDPNIIKSVIPSKLNEFYAANLMTAITDPVEVVDNTNIKVVTDDSNNALFMSRNPIPYPRGTMEYKFYKHLGVLAYSKDALCFFVETSKGRNEMIEDVNELRFIEHGKHLKMIEVASKSLSVDTPKDLEHVRNLAKNYTNERFINENQRS